MAEGTELRISINAAGAVKGARVFKRSSDAISKSARKAATSTNVLATSMNTAGQAASKLRGLLPGVGGALALGIAIKQLAGFESIMSTVGAVTKATSGQMVGLTATARTLGAQTQFSAIEAAEGMKFLGMAGFETSEIIAAIGPSLDLAKAGALGLGQAADIASNIMSTFGLNAEDMNVAVDALAATATNANTTVDMLGEAIKFVGPVAKSVGITLQDTAAYMGILGNAGLQASLGGTGLRIALMKMLKPSKEGAEALRDMGLSAAEVNPEMNKLEDVLRKFSKAGLNATDATTLFGARGAGAMLVLTRAAGGAVSEMDKMLKITRNSAGEAKRMAEIMGDNLTGKFKEVTSALSEMILQLGDAGLMGILVAITTTARDFIRGLIDMNSMLDEGTMAMEGAYLAGATLRDGLSALVDLVKFVAPWAAAAAALWGVQAAMVGIPALASAAVVKLITLNATLLTTASVAGVISGAFLLLGAAFVGFSIGTLLNKFEFIQVAGIKMVGFFLELAATFGTVFNKVEAILSHVAQTVDNSFFEMIASGKEWLASLPFVTDAYKDFQLKSAAAARANIKATGDLGAELEKMDSAYLNTIDGIKTSTKVLLEDSAAKNAAKDAGEGVVTALERQAKVAQLSTSAISIMNREYSSMESLQSAMTKVVTKLVEKQKVGILTNKELVTILKAVNLGYSTQDAVLNSLEKQTAKAASVFAKLKGEFEELRDKIDPVGAATRNYQKELKALDAQYKGGVIKTEKEYLKLRDMLTKSFDDGCKSVDALSSCLRSLVDELDPLSTLTADYDRDVKNLTDNQVLLTKEGHNVAEMLQKLEENYKKGTIEIQKNAGESPAWTAAWENAIKRIDDAFFDLWESAFDGFDSFLDSMKDALKTFAAQTLHNLFTKPLLDSVTGLFAEGGGGFMDGITSLFSGGSGSSSSGGIDLGAAGSIFSYGKDLWSGFTSGAGGSFSLSGGLDALIPDAISEGFSGFDKAAGAFFKEYAPGFSDTAVTGAQVYDPSSGALVDATAASVDWTQIGISMAAAFVGGQVGNVAGEGLFGKEANSSYGQTAGALIGGALAGPIGAFVGATIGSIADVAFGSENKRRNALNEIDFATGETIFSTNDGDSPGHGQKDTLAKMTDVLNLYADAIGGSDAKIKFGVTNKEDPFRLIFGEGRYEKFEDIDKFFAAAFDELLDGATELGPKFKMILKGFDGTIEEMFSFGAIMLDTRDIIEDGGLSLEKLKQEITEFETAGRSLTDTYQAQADVTLELARNFESTIDGAGELNASIRETQGVFSGLALEALSVSNSINQTITGMITNLVGATRTEADFMQQSLTNAQELFDEIATLSDPAKVEENVNQVISIWDDLYGRLMSGLNDQLQVSVALGDAARNAAEAIGDMFSNSIQSFTKDTLNDNQLQGYLQDEINATFAGLEALETPAEVESATSRINANMNELWGALPDEDKIRQLSNFTSFMQEVNDLAAVKLKDIEDEAGTDEANIRNMMQGLTDVYAEQLGLLNDAAQTRMDAILLGLSEAQQKVNDELGILLIQGSADMAAAGTSINEGARAFAAAAGAFNPQITVTVNQEGEVLAG
jgi:TP901 family phage tail tape measure protein